MRFAADALSLLRGLLAIPLIMLGLTGNWKLAFILLLLAWATDPLDGMLARKYGSYQTRHPTIDFDADGIADSILAFLSSSVPVIYAWFNLPKVVAITLSVVYLLTYIAGTAMVIVMNNTSSRFVRSVIRINMIVFHGLLQIVATIAWFGFMAFGMPAVIAVLVGSIVLGYTQRRKIELWFRGRIA